MDQPNQSIELIRSCFTRYAAGKGLSLVESEDIVEEALLDYFGSRQKWYEEDPQPQPTLLWKILRRRIVDLDRREIAEDRAMAIYAQGFQQRHINEDDTIDYLLACQVVESITPFWRQVVNMRAEGWKWGEIANHLKISVGTLTKQWERILQKYFKTLGIECRKKGRSSDIITDECSIAVNVPCEEVNEDGTTPVSDTIGTDTDVAESYRFSKHPPRPNKCRGGSFDFLRGMSPGNCGCSSNERLSPHEMVMQLEANQELMKRQGTQVAGPATLNTVPCPTDCGTSSFGAVYFCLDEPNKCPTSFQPFWWWRHIILYWNCP